MAVTTNLQPVDGTNTSTASFKFGDASNNVIVRARPFNIKLPDGSIERSTFENDLHIFRNAPEGSRAVPIDDDFYEEANGTWTVDFSFFHIKPIRGIPSRELAKQISDALWECHKAGADAYAETGPER